MAQHLLLAMQPRVPTALETLSHTLSTLPTSSSLGELVSITAPPGNLPPDIIAKNLSLAQLSSPSSPPLTGQTTPFPHFSLLVEKLATSFLGFFT